MTTVEKLRRPQVSERRRAAPPFEVRGAALVRCGITGRPKFDFPLCMYPSWAQDEFRKVMTESEIGEFFT